MIIPADITRKHALIAPYIDEVANRVTSVVRSYCEAMEFAYLGRTKGPNSLAEKVETGRFARWSALDDFFGCTVIVPTLDDEPSTLEFLSQRFDTVALRRRGTTKKDPAVFRFDATRFVGRLKAADFPEPTLVTSVSFEVQVRTAFEHAWSVTTHALAYKGQVTDWKRVRLAAQLKATVEQLDALIAGYENVAGLLGEHPWPEIDAKGEIEDFFQGLVTKNKLPTDVAPQSWVRFSENLYSVIIGSTDRHVRDPLAHVRSALSQIDAEVDGLTLDSFPRSVSLVQFCIGALVNQRFISGPLRNYVPLITKELYSLFPTISVLGPGFDLEIESAA